MSSRTNRFERNGEMVQQKESRERSSSDRAENDANERSRYARRRDAQRARQRNGYQRSPLCPDATEFVPANHQQRRMLNVFAPAFVPESAAIAH